MRREPIISTNTDAYTPSDHLIRNDDKYALTKYKMTTHWLGSCIKPGQTLFNIGCGGGIYNLEAVDLGLETYGYEPDPETFQIAQKNCGSAPRVHLKQKGLFEIPDDNGNQADFIVMHDVLEHMEDEKGAVTHL